MAYTSSVRTSLTASPQGEAFWVAVLPSPSLITMSDSRPQPCPRGTPMKSAQGVRSTTEGEIFKGTDGACADPGTQNFPCHGAQNGSAAFQSYQLDFHVTHRFFVTFFTEESNVPPVPRRS